MNSFRFFAVIACVAAASATPMVQSESESNSVWKGTTMDSTVRQLQTECTEQNDAVSCMKHKVLQLLDQVFNKDVVQVSESIEVVRNTAGRSARAESSSADLLDQVEEIVKSRDVVVRLPGPVPATLTLSPRNLDLNELNLSVKLQEGREGKEVGDEARKSKLKKILIPIVVLIMLKAMTLIPLAIGMLGLKAWNALQLSFFSFVVSLALAVFQLCKKISADASMAQVAAHGPWENYQAAHYAARGLDAQGMAYNAYS